MALRDRSLRRNRARAIRMSEGENESHLPLATVIMLCSLVSTLLLLTSP